MRALFVCAAPLAVSVSLALLGCGNGGTTGVDAGPDSAPDVAAQVEAGTGTITGSADGTPFNTVAQSLWLGAPDAPSTTVVYLFSKPVAAAIWQRRGGTSASRTRRSFSR